MIFHSWSAVFEHVKRSPEILFLTPSQGESGMSPMKEISKGEKSVKLA